MNLFELFIKIGVDDQASDKIGGISEKLSGGLKTAAKVGAAAVATVTAAATAMTGAFVKGASDVAAYGDNIDKMSQKMGLSAQAYQEWDFIMQHSGTSIESLQAGMKTLANAVESGNKAFERLGITQEEIAALNQEQLFSRTISALQEVENETERTYLAGQLLGRGATELGALLNTSAEDTEAMRKQVHELGGVMSDEAVKAAAAYQDSLQNMKTAFAGVQRGLLSDFLPSMVSVMDGLALIFSGNDSGIAKITEGVGDFADNLFEAVPKIFELGEGIISSLFDAIIENLPLIAQSATEIIIKLVEGIMDNFDALLDAAFQIIDMLLDGIIDNLDRVVAMGIELIGKLIAGIIGAIPDLVGKVPELIGALARTFTNLSQQIVDIGRNIISSLWDGIRQAWNNLTSWFSNAWDSLFGNRKVDVGVNAKVNGSHATGLDYVPFDGYIAELHKGEMVVPAGQAKFLRSGETENRDVVINITNTLDGKEIGKTSYRYAQDEARAMGV